MSTSGVVEVIASRTKIRRHPGEDYTDYLDRLDKTHGVGESDRERLELLAEKELFAQNPSLSDEEKREVVEICDRVLDTEAAESNEMQGMQASVADTTVSSNTRPRDLYEYVQVDSDTATTPMSRINQERRSSRSLVRDLNKVRQYLRRNWTSADVVYLLPLLTCGVFTFFYGLGDFPLSTWDEGFYANLARHMVQDGYWVVPHMYYAIGFSPNDFEPWLRLPPLGIWLQAVSMLVFGVNEFAVRFPSATASVLTVVVVYLVGRDIESRRTGFVAGLVYLTTPQMYTFNAGRDGALDSLLVLFGSLFVYTAWLAVSQDERRWLYPMGLFAGLAVLTKGFGAGVFLIVVLPLVFFAQRVFVSKEMGLAVGLTGLLTLPWPIYIYSQYRDIFVQEFFVRYVFERAAGGAFGTNTNTLFSFMEYPYIIELLFAPNLFHPWSFILVIGIPVYAYQRFTTGNQNSTIEAGFLVWWIIATFGLFVFIGNKVWYILPMYVPAAVLVGGIVDEAISGELTESLVVALGAGFMLIISPAYSLIPTPDELIAPGTVFTIGVILVVWAAPIRDRLGGRIPPTASSTVSKLAPLVVAIILIGSFVGVPQTTADSPQQALAEELNQQSPDPELVFIESEMEVAFHTFSFYAQRPLESGPISELDSSGARYAVVTEESLSEIDANTRTIMTRTIPGNQQVSLVEVDR
jgi:4-amino-4-deoxy-L-arabinose transferase-like glycosyltransferase